MGAPFGRRLQVSGFSKELKAEVILARQLF